MVEPAPEGQTPAFNIITSIAINKSFALGGSLSAKARGGGVFKGEGYLSHTVKLSF